MANTPPPTTLLERLLDSIVDQLTPEAAEVFTNLYAPDDVKARLDALVEKTMRGGLDQAEQDEYDGLMQIVNTVSMIQDRIDMRLAGGSTPEPTPTPGTTYIESIDLGTPRVIPRPGGSPASVHLEGLEALLDDLDETMKPRRRD
ncbi:hypothetical protein [Paludisphaera rhizosphaerae]|uniref:hypothetical protein n=1 Tax=Paludisphaera rhizosphaerae TaxID=2711216 RepID=UPI0013E9DA90|nr:hypothetical protein [Paludisphaera rhizosphaerae]